MAFGRRFVFLLFVFPLHKKCPSGMCPPEPSLISPLTSLIIYAAVIMIYSAVSSAMQAWHESTDERQKQRRALLDMMSASKSYYEWSLHASKLDALDGGSSEGQETRWRQETRFYDRRLVEEKIAHLKAVRLTGGNTVERMFSVRADLLRNLGNIANAALHEHFPVIPGPIREYIDEVCLHLDDITHAVDVPLAEKAAFLKETRHAFGRTALILSGGGVFGSFHLGVVKALLEQKLLPRVLAGSSMGAFVGALVCTRTDMELTSLLQDVSGLDLSFFLQVSGAKSFKGSSYSIVKRLRHILGDLTFLEAYAITGRVFSVSVSLDAGSSPSDQHSGTNKPSNDPPRLLNYLTAPDALIWSAVACALPIGVDNLHLLARSATGELVRFAAGDVEGKPSPGQDRSWRDGSLEDVIPMRGMSEMFSVNHFIVSQTTPHIVPILNLKRRLGMTGQLLEAEFKHRCRQALELLQWPWPARWLRAFSQPWEGDVTIVLPERDAALQLAKAMVGTTQADILHAAHQGEVCTWAKLSAIQSNCGIEAMLDACIQQVISWERSDLTKRQKSDSSTASPPPKGQRGDGIGETVVQHQQRPTMITSAASLDSFITYSDGEDIGPILLQKHNAGNLYSLDCTDESANPFSPLRREHVAQWGHAGGASKHWGLDLIAP
jgi:TAG lipase/steryl ester hydrolase/phospholipase A2/LPA acyltransferase